MKMSKTRHEKSIFGDDAIVFKESSLLNDIVVIEKDEIVAEKIALSIQMHYKTALYKVEDYLRRKLGIPFKVRFKFGSDTVYLLISYGHNDFDQVDGEMFLGLYDLHPLPDQTDLMVEEYIRRIIKQLGETLFFHIGRQKEQVRIFFDTISKRDALSAVTVNQHIANFLASCEGFDDKDAMTVRGIVMKHMSKRERNRLIKSQNQGFFARIFG